MSKFFNKMNNPGTSDIETPSGPLTDAEYNQVLSENPELCLTSMVIGVENFDNMFNFHRQFFGEEIDLYEDSIKRNYHLLLFNHIALLSPETLGTLEELIKEITVPRILQTVSALKETYIRLEEYEKCQKIQEFTEILEKKFS